MVSFISHSLVECWKSLNLHYDETITVLKENGSNFFIQVTYLNEYASFLDLHTVKTVNKKKVEKKVTAETFVLATGGRPKYPEIPGAQEFGITSDDIFSLQKPPGKSMLVGASYIALECAGFLHGVVRNNNILLSDIY